MTKHAFLVMAHNEFSLLKRLLSCLDDSRNDIFIHFDQKTSDLPVLKTTRAGLFILNDRVNVHWGDVSVIEAEYKLFEAATARGTYAYYHLLSGVDLPLKSQDELHAFFNKHQGREFIGFSQDVKEEEINRRVRKVHLYPERFRASTGLAPFCYRIVRKCFLELQYLLNIQRNQNIIFKKGAQWVSVTDKFVHYVLPQKQQVLKTYRQTFCSDELFLQTICWNSPFRSMLFDAEDESRGSQRIIGWKNGQLYEWNQRDYGTLISSDIVFARKFSSNNPTLIDLITHQVRANKRNRVYRIKDSSSLESAHNKRLKDNMHNSPKVSIIIPVYNAQNTLERTLISLRNQRYEHIEFIFIDDASSDCSMSLIEQFAVTVPDFKAFTVKIITLHHNKGVANARNEGLNHAEGKFVMYVDADDTIDPDAVEACVREAEKMDADIVCFHWWLSFSSNERRMIQPSCNTPLEAIKLMLAGQMRWNLWLFMVRRSIYQEHSIRFIPDANMGEDLCVMLKILAHARKISMLDKSYYHYRQDNGTSISKSYSAKHLKDIENNITETENYLYKSQYASALGHGIDFLKLNIKLPLLVTGAKTDYEQWLSWFKSSNKYILKNRDIPLRTRALQWMAWKRQYWAVWLYNFMVLRLIYGIIYK